MNNYAPVVLFVYNRPDHTQRALNALSNNSLASESDLYIFSDAPKNPKAADSVQRVRDIIKSISGFKTVTIIQRDVNFGLQKSISEGVTDIVRRYGKIIVLEDDLITHKQFLEFMNKGLDLYKDNKDVYQVTGYSHISGGKNLTGDAIQNAAYFLKITSTWGWGTWADSWEIFFQGLKDIEKLSNRKVKYEFNYDNSYNYYKMLNDTIAGKAKSWGIVWYWNLFKNNGLTLHPTETLIDQIGFDGTGQNSRNHVVESSRIKPQDYEFVLPDQIVELPQYRKRIVKKLRSRKLFLILKLISHILRIKSK